MKLWSPTSFRNLRDLGVGEIEISYIIKEALHQEGKNRITLSTAILQETISRQAWERFPTDKVKVTCAWQRPRWTL